MSDEAFVGEGELVLAVSGLYLYRSVVPVPLPQPDTIPVGLAEESEKVECEDVDALAAILPLSHEELRLDVDRSFPQRVVSGAIYLGTVLRLHWIARLTLIGPRTWKGTIFYKDGVVAALPHTTVQVKVTGIAPATLTATLVFSGGGAAIRTRVYKFQSPYFHPVEFEYDNVAGVPITATYATHSHPVRPATLASENLTIETVYKRAGFDVRKSLGDSVVPLAGAGGNSTWSDAEMHDAMQTYWSRFANKPQWSLWVLFANRHDMGSGLGGIMFDSIGPNHRQGTALFINSFIATPPAGDPAPAAWVKRMIFWTATHEMGHAFNLAHSWQKSLGTPWLPLPNEPEARSYMNYPYNVAGGVPKFFSDFQFRFTDSELLFMRHAPERFVQMGNASWFDHHGFEQLETYEGSAFRLTVSAPRKGVYEFLEPVILQLELTNVSDEPQIIPEDLLLDLHSMTIVVKRAGAEARQLRPIRQYCLRGRNQVLEPKQKVSAPLMVSVDTDAWLVSEPGQYQVQVALHALGQNLLSNLHRFRVSAPRGYEEEAVALDFFTDGVGRALVLGGTLSLDDANAVLEDAAARLPTRRVAIHANAALALPRTRDFKQLGSDADGNLSISAVPADPEEAATHLALAMANEAEAAATLNLQDDDGAALAAFGGVVDSRAELARRLFRQHRLSQGNTETSLQALRARPR